MREFVIKKLNDFLSRKLLLLLLSTWLLYLGKIGQFTWLAIASIYIGANLTESYLSNQGKDGEK